jgi:hypothetical protein
MESICSAFMFGARPNGTFGHFMMPQRGWFEAEQCLLLAFRTSPSALTMSAAGGIVLQNSKNGLQRFFREKSSQATFADRCVLKRATEVAGEFIASAMVPHTIMRSPSPQPGKLVFSDPKIVLQHYRR